MVMKKYKPVRDFPRTMGGWQDCELRVLKSMVRNYYPSYYIADVLDRNYHSVVQKIKALRRKREL